MHFRVIVILCQSYCRVIDQIGHRIRKVIFTGHKTRELSYSRENTIGLGEFLEVCLGKCVECECSVVFGPKWN